MQHAAVVSNHVNPFSNHLAQGPYSTRPCPIPIKDGQEPAPFQQLQTQNLYDLVSYLSPNWRARPGAGCACRGAGCACWIAILRMPLLSLSLTSVSLSVSSFFSLSVSSFFSLTVSALFSLSVSSA